MRSKKLEKTKEEVYAQERLKTSPLKCSEKYIPLENNKEKEDAIKTNSNSGSS